MNDLFITLFLPALIFNILLRLIQYLMDRYCLRYMGSGTWKSKIMNAMIIFILSSSFIIYYLTKFNGTFDTIIQTYILVALCATAIQLLLDMDTFGQYNKDINLLIGEIITAVALTGWYYLIVL